MEHWCLLKTAQEHVEKELNRDDTKKNKKWWYPSCMLTNEEKKPKKMVNQQLHLNSVVEKGHDLSSFFWAY